MTTPFHRHIGGIHWFALGPWRVSLCRVRESGTGLPGGGVHPRPRPIEMLRAGIRSACLNPTGDETVFQPHRLPHTSLFPWPPESHT
jgi:hypothetical protein